MPNSNGGGPLCPRCHRPIAAWRLNHCVYCGERFPEGFREGFQEPAALQWVERPGVPPEATKQLELMKVVAFDKDPKTRSVGAILGLLSLPVFAVIFYLLYGLVARTSPAAAALIVIAGLGFLGYLGWSFFRSRNGK
ncbi:MAG TPA: hypothetical protein VMR54_12580 [Thermoanaerobaculia bacterium]|nr:hypothetical protein [Thermoanaerobaculia bacterium]